MRVEDFAQESGQGQVKLVKGEIRRDRVGRGGQGVGEADAVGGMSVALMAVPIRVWMAW